MSFLTDVEAVSFDTVTTNPWTRCWRGCISLLAIPFALVYAWKRRRKHIVRETDALLDAITRMVAEQDAHPDRPDRI